MAKFTDTQIRAWIRRGERFEAKADGLGLYLRFRKEDAVPQWIFRYRLAGVARKMHLGSYSVLALADARRTARELKARVTLGYDVADEKRARRNAVKEKALAERDAMTVGKLADEYFERMVLGRWKHPNIVRSRIEKDIRPHLGNLALDAVKPSHIDKMLRAIVKRGAPTMANDVLRWTKRMFDYAIKRQMCKYNPAAPFDLADAGGAERARDRWLTAQELAALFAAMRAAKGWVYENDLVVKLLLMLAVRRGELIGARIEEFDLGGAVWHLPAERTKSGSAIDIPLPSQAVALLRDLARLADGSDWLLPARRQGVRMRPHIEVSTLGAALQKAIWPTLEAQGIPPFTIHDFRRTARTHLAIMGVW